MIKSLIYRLKYIAPAIAAVMLSACASSDDRPEAPSYATVYDNDSYRVICTGATRREIYVRYNALDSFYRDDGSLKPRDEFCRENTSGASQL